MRHQLRIPLLSKPADQRKALLRGLTTQLIREGRVTTTKARAKALRSEVERMISLAKDGSLASRRRAIGYIYDKKLVQAMEIDSQVIHENGKLMPKMKNFLREKAIQWRLGNPLSNV